MLPGVSSARQAEGKHPSLGGSLVSGSWFCSFRACGPCVLGFLSFEKALIILLCIHNKDIRNCEKFSFFFFSFYFSSPAAESKGQNRFQGHGQSSCKIKQHSLDLLGFNFAGASVENVIKEKNSLSQDLHFSSYLLQNPTPHHHHQNHFTVFRMNRK